MGRADHDLGDFAPGEPELATFVAERLCAAPSYLARPDEVRSNGSGDIDLPAHRRWRADS